ncbi:hypothetical protein TIFTF001_042273 [Ficus carica]|uniref:Uncharacterized protein n=1 Tax=Ficus carica TaxID=3494 RepID=A0AA88A7V7_FICCA|nr:hypothetical protein TIFTF001_042271 [Ficus carica]GMN35714.1 hypothetical protein TIFTF001_042273 [Ficus carica]
MEERCQKMAEKLAELEGQLAASKKENKELKEKGKDREEVGRIDLDDIDSEEIKLRADALDGKNNKKTKQR